MKNCYMVIVSDYGCKYYKMIGNTKEIKEFLNRISKIMKESKEND